MSHLENLDVLKIIAENTTDIILFADNDGKVIYATQSLSGTLGYKEDKLIGQDAFTTLHPDDRERVRRLHMDVVRRKQALTCEYRVFHEDGTILYFEAKVKPVLDQNLETRLSVVVIRDISDRKKVEIALRESAERYRILQDSIIQLSNKQHNGTDETPTWVLRLLFNLFEKEHLTLSDDLHDSVLQNLINWYRKVENIHSSPHMDERWKTDLLAIEEGLLDSIYEIKKILTGLRPPFLKELGVVHILQNLFDYTTQFNSNTAITFHSHETSYDLTEEQILGMYRIAKELLDNALKHSEANTVEFMLSCEGDNLSMSYQDDGKGFEIGLLDNSLTHIGISGIRKRVESMLGTSTFVSSPSKGLKVKIEIPLMLGLIGGNGYDKSVAD